jgi:hypothetical protein
VARVAAVDIIDELFIVADPQRVRDHLCDTNRWRTWFPELQLAPYQDRGPQGVRWEMSGALTGTAEVWLEPFGDGVIVHAYLRGTPPTGPTAGRRFAVQTEKQWVLPLKRRLLDAKDELEADRPVGEPRIPLAERVVVSQSTQTDHGADKGASRHGRPDDVEHPDRGKAGRRDGRDRGL